MAKLELIMPKMGESIIEATILKWLKKEGDPVEAEETILEIATDKVDSEIPSPAKGVMGKLLFDENAVVPVGAVIAHILTGDSSPEGEVSSKPAPAVSTSTTPTPTQSIQLSANPQAQIETENRFYSPLVKSIAKQENISRQELDSIQGTGEGGRVTKRDVIQFLETGRPKSKPSVPTTIIETKSSKSIPASSTPTISSSASMSGAVEIVEMDRMRKLIADHMVMSKQTSPHVTSFVEVDVTGMVKWRDKVKDEFTKKYGQKITFTPLFIEAVCRAIKDYPMINVSVDGNRILVKRDINIGMAAALPSGNLIVPVIKNADRLNLAGLTYQVNDLASRARANKLKPEEIQEGSFTLTNVGTFGNVMGTPIINQPQVAILATGTITKKPAVIETEDGDVIAIRHMMFLSLSYDHRVVDGSLGGSFLKRIGDYLEKFDTKQTI